MKPSANLWWFIETRGVTLWDLEGDIHLSIPYPHAGLWALVSNGNYRRTAAVELLSLLMSIEIEEAEREVEETLAFWAHAGLLSGE